METAALDTVQVDGLTIGYRELGDGPPVVLLHGWPTSSYLWRDVMPAIARTNRVIAPDLPGFGVSDKPAGVRYDFAFFERALDGLLAALGVDAVGLAVHDLGGPIGVHWAVAQPRARHAPRAAQHARLPGVLARGDRVRHGPDHARAARAGHQPGGPGRAACGSACADESKATRRADRGVRRPVRRRRLPAGAGGRGRGPRLRGASPTSSSGSPSCTIPVRIVYGEQDRVLHRRRRDDGARGARPPAGGRHRAARPRALPPGGGAGARSASCLREFFRACPG